jgi:hypothetical protein
MIFFTLSHFHDTSIQLLDGSRLFGCGCMNIIESGDCSALRSTDSALSLCHAKSFMSSQQTVYSMIENQLNKLTYICIIFLY